MMRRKRLEERNKTISIFNGPEPEIKIFESEKEEWEYVSDWITKQVSDGLAFHEIGIFIRSLEQKERAVHAVHTAKYPFVLLDETVETISGKIAISTMHLAKGLEFRSVVVMACDDEVAPLQQRIESVTDNSDLEEVYNTERYLLYVACTRARDCLLVTAIAPGSEFLDDLGVK